MFCNSLIDCFLNFGVLKCILKSNIDVGHSILRGRVLSLEYVDHNRCGLFIYYRKGTWSEMTVNGTCFLNGDHYLKSIVIQKY